MEVRKKIHFWKKIHIWELKMETFLSEEDEEEVKIEHKPHIQKDAKRKSKLMNPSEKCTQFSWWNRYNSLA